MSENEVPQEQLHMHNAQSGVGANGGVSNGSDADSPEILRWRAELLLDEMMIGAVDVSAGDSRQRPFSSAHAGAASFARPLLVNEDGPSDFGAFGSAPAAAASVDQNAPSHTTDPRTAQATATPPFSAASWSASSVTPSASSSLPAQPERTLVSVEQRYAPYRREQSSAGVAQAAPPNGDNGVREGVRAAVEPAPISGLGPVRRSMYGAALNTSPSNRAASRYANLLPRDTSRDVNAMQREAASLNEEIAVLLPPGHESSKRAHHLLEKADAILQNESMSSAEVDYYLQQVRAIVQRVRQTAQWSTMYQHRLVLYLVAWVLLALVVIVGSLLYSIPLSHWFENRFGWQSSGLLHTHFVPLLIALLAGALGGAIGALYNMRRDIHREFGFVDRKYSLRGLILPLLGIFFGVVVYLVFGAIYWMLGQTPVDHATLELLPAGLAFLVGGLQESLYGTRS